MDSLQSEPLAKSMWRWNQSFFLSSCSLDLPEYLAHHKPMNEWISEDFKKKVDTLLVASRDIKNPKEGKYSATMEFITYVKKQKIHMQKNLRMLSKYKILQYKSNTYLLRRN